MSFMLAIISKWFSYSI